MQDKIYGSLFGISYMYCREYGARLSIHQLGPGEEEAGAKRIHQRLIQADLAGDRHPAEHTLALEKNVGILLLHDARAERPHCKLASIWSKRGWTTHSIEEVKTQLLSNCQKFTCKGRNGRTSPLWRLGKYPLHPQVTVSAYTLTHENTLPGNIKHTHTGQSKLYNDATNPPSQKLPVKAEHKAFAAFAQWRPYSFPYFWGLT